MGLGAFGVLGLSEFSGLGMKVLGDLGFRGFGFRDIGFRCLGCKVSVLKFRVQGLEVSQTWGIREALFLGSHAETRSIF